MRAVKSSAVFFFATAVHTAAGIRSATSVVHGGDIAATEIPEMPVDMEQPQESDLLMAQAWTTQRQKRAKEPSRLLRAFRFVLSGLGSSHEARFAHEVARNSLLQEHVDALHAHGVLKKMDAGCGLKVEASSEASLNSSSLLEASGQSQSYLATMSESQLQMFAESIMSVYGGRNRAQGDDGPGDNAPHERDYPDNVTPGFKDRMASAWKWFRNAASGFRGGYGNAFANFLGVGFGNPCIIKILFAFYKHEGEDDYPYFPKGCFDNFGEIMVGDARATVSPSISVLSLLSAALCFWAVSSNAQR